MMIKILGYLAKNDSSYYIDYYVLRPDIYYWKNIKITNVLDNKIKKDVKEEIKKTNSKN